MPKITVPDTGRENQVVVMDGHFLPIRGIDEDTALIFVQALDLTHDHSRIFLSSQYPTDRGTNLPGRKD